MIGLRKRVRRIRTRIARAWDRVRAPWPIVGECYGGAHAGHACPQCDGSHEHVWVAWQNAPRWVTSGPGVPVRCRRCGARKCDRPLCARRRHDHRHGDPTGRTSR